MQNNITTQEDIKQLIIDMEQKWPVDKWMINHVHLWPYIRIKIYIHFLVQMNKGNAAKENRNLASKTTNKVLSHFLKILKVIPASARLIYFFLKLKKKEILFFGSHIHRVLNDNKHFNRFYDSMVSHHKLENDVYMIEYQKAYDKMYNQNAVIELKKVLNDYTLLTKFTSKFSKPTIELENYNDFYLQAGSDIKDLNNLKISIKDLTKWANKIKSLKLFYKIFYKKVKPSKIVFLGYYGLDDLTAALLVGNEFKIKTIDFQHGPQTNIHMAYTSWTKIPKESFNIMPVEFWNWDLPSKNNIDEWANVSQNVKAVVIGQPFISYYLNKVKNSNTSQEKKIFYSLQTTPFAIEDMITPKVISLIKSSKLNWILRLHPRNNLNLEELNQYLIFHNIQYKTTIQDAYHSPLPESLNSSVLHVTNYSGCLIEAYLMGIPTVLIHNMGKEMFSSYIDNSKVFFLEQNTENFENDFSNLIDDLQQKIAVRSQLEIYNPLS